MTNWIFLTKISPIEKKQIFKEYDSERAGYVMEKNNYNNNGP